MGAVPALAQDGRPERAPDPNAQNPAWHAQQQLYLLGLKVEDGWYSAEGGLRWRWILGAVLAIVPVAVGLFGISEILLSAGLVYLVYLRRVLRIKQVRRIGVAGSGIPHVPAAGLK